MKKIALLLLIAALLTSPLAGCSSGKPSDDTSGDTNRVVAPDDPETEKRPTTEKADDTSGGSEDTKPTPVTTSAPISDTVESSPVTTDTTASKEVVPAVPMTYRLEYKVADGRYLLDADYNLAFVKDGEDPVFHKGVRTKFIDGRSSVFCSDLNRSLLLEKDGSAIGVVQGRLASPDEGYMISFVKSDSTDFVLCDYETGEWLSDTVYRGYNKREDGCLSLLLGSREISVFDGSEIIENRKFEIVYYYATTYILVREDGFLRFYDTNFNLLMDYGEISAANRIHFSETKRDGDSFEFFFDSGSYKYDPSMTPASSAEVIDEKNGVKLCVDKDGGYFITKNGKTTALEGLTDPLCVELITGQDEGVYALGKDLETSVYRILGDTVEKAGGIRTSSEKSGDLTLVQGTKRSYVLDKSGKVLLSGDGYYTVIGNWLLHYALQPIEAYTLTGKPVVTSDTAISITPLSDGRLLVGEKNCYQIYSVDCEPGFKSGIYDLIYFTVRENILVNENGLLQLITLDGGISADFGKLDDWTDLRLIQGQSGYEAVSGDGGYRFRFTFDGFRDGKYGSVEYCFYPTTGEISKTYNVEINDFDSRGVIS